MKHTKGQSMPDGTIQYYKDAMGRAMVSTDYDPTSSYAVGDYCIYDNVRYCCNTAIASGGETWNSAHWDVAKVDDDVTEIKQSLSDLVITLFKTSQTLTNQDFDSLPLGLVYNSGTCAHSPINGAVYMLVITICIDSASAPKGQFAIDFNGTNTNSDIYFRNQTAGTWRAWKKLNNS